VNDLRALLVDARDRGFLGDQAIERQLEHANGFADVCIAVLEPEPSMTAARFDRETAPEPQRQLLDLGAGGGLPVLVLASKAWPFEVRTVLLDGSVRRAEWLQYAVTELGLDATVDVLGERAEIAGRSPAWRHRQSVVVARSFGRPAVTAECAAPLLSAGGVLVVSEPPSLEPFPRLVGDGSGARAVETGSPELMARWPPRMIAELGFAPATEWRARGYRYAVLRTENLCSERYPRRNGIPAKRPLF
jgi:16S rRNA (guanine527-N7)-methyltransferase